MHDAGRQFMSHPVTQGAMFVGTSLISGGLLNSYRVFNTARLATAPFHRQTIIGEGMKRVSAVAAKHPNSTMLNNMPKFTGTPHQVTSKMMQYNRKWLLQQMRSGRSIMDIGRDPTRKIPSIFYQMERNMIKNYQKIHSNALKVIR